MKIDNLCLDLINSMVCPVSREKLTLVEANLVTSSGYIYPEGDFRMVSGVTQNPEWTKGQLHYEKFHNHWLRRPDSFYSSVDLETKGIYKAMPLNGRVLDVGGGFGTVSIQASLDPSNIICIDPMVCRWEDLPDSTFKSHYSALKNIIRIPGFAEALPFPNSSFDTVHMRSCLDHFADPHRSLLEARRILKPTGKLIIGLALEGAFKLNQNGLRNKMKRKIKNSIIGDLYEHLFDAHMFHPTKDSLSSLLDSSGFLIDEWINQEGYHDVVYISASLKI